jgi:hypothetical protein
MGIVTFDFMTTHVQEGFGGRGHFEMGNEGLLKYLGFEYVGEGTDPRYKQIWKLDGKEFESDGRWMHLKSNKGGVYDFDALCRVVKIPEDKMWLKEKGWWQLWRIADEEDRGEMLCAGVGVARHSFSSRKLFKQIAGFKEKFKERFKDNPEIDFDELYSDVEVDFPFGYFENLEVFGDQLAGMVTLSRNLYPMSGTFKPHELYATPQCGEFEEHQVLLDKFAEINREYVRQRSEDE